MEHVRADRRGAARVKAERIELDRGREDRRHGEASDGLRDATPVEVTVTVLGRGRVGALRRRGDEVVLRLSNNEDRRRGVREGKRDVDGAHGRRRVLRKVFQPAAQQLERVQ